MFFCFPLNFVEHCDSASDSFCTTADSSGEQTTTEVAALLGVYRITLYRALNKEDGAR